MKKILTLFLVLIAFCTLYAQKVSNVVAKQLGDKIIITYDLDRSTNIYVYPSYDGGISFEPALTKVSGDVGRVSAGHKTIVWDALQERETFTCDKLVFDVSPIHLSHDEKLAICQRIHTSFTGTANNHNVWEEGPALFYEFWRNIEGKEYKDTPHKIYIDFIISDNGTYEYHVGTRLYNLDETRKVFADKEIFPDQYLIKNQCNWILYKTLPSSATDAQILSTLSELVDKIKTWTNKHPLCTKITDLQVTDLSISGYTVSCKVSCPLHINRVQFPTWTRKDDQDDIISDWVYNQRASGTRNGDTFTYRVNSSEHNNESGTYFTHIYVYADGGSIEWDGQTCAHVNGVVVPESEKSWKWVRLCDLPHHYVDHSYLIDQKNIIISKIRFNFSDANYLSTYNCYMFLRSTTNPNYSADFSIAGDSYYKAGKYESIKANCTDLGNNVYEYNINQVQDAFIAGWQENFPSHYIEIYAFVPNN